MKTVRKGARTLGLISKTRRGRSQETGNAWPVTRTTRFGTRRKKIGKGEGAVKRAVKRAGPSRRKVEKALRP
jgi:hypothetical protein